MDKKKVIIASGIAAAAVVVGVGSMYYAKHNQKQDTHPNSTALSKEETTELLESAFASMDSADISMNSTVRWTTGSAATVGDGVENMDADSSVAEEQTSEIAGEQTSDTYDESTLSATAQFSGKNAHGQWTSQYTSNAMTDAAASESTDGEFYMSEADGAVTGYAKTSADTTWVKTDNVENAVSGPDYMKNFTYGKLENVEADKNDDGSYIIHADMAYADATQAAGLVTGNTVSISDDDFSGASTAVEIMIDKDKKATSLLMVTDNTEKTDTNADGKIAESNNISITFNQNDDVTASLLNEETRQSIENEIQAAADAAAQEQENATIEENADTANGDASNINNDTASNSNSGSSSSSNSGTSSSGNSSSKKSSSSGNKSNNSGSGSSSSNAGSGNYVYGQDTPGVESTITIGDDRPSDYGQTPSNVTDQNQVGNGSWESEGKPDYVDKEFAGGYVPDDYTPGHE